MAGEFHRNGADFASLFRLLDRYDGLVKFTVYCSKGVVRSVSGSAGFEDRWGFRYTMVYW